MTAPAVSPHITEIASRLVREILPEGCEKWRIDQLMHEATTAKDVLIRFWRERNWS